MMVTKYSADAVLAVPQPDAQGQRQTRQPEIGRAPGHLALLQAFVNTLDIEQSTDELADPAALVRWLRRAGLLGGAVAKTDRAPVSATPADLTDAIGLREALRGVLRSHVTHGAAARRRPSEQPAVTEPPHAALSELRRISAGLPTRVEVGADGEIGLAAAGSGVHAGLARMMLIAAQAATLGTWTRLKVCSADDCQWAFYDRSPTRNGCWCSMQICGSRAKSRAYRKRAAAGNSA